MIPAGFKTNARKSKRKFSYADDHHGNTRTRKHETSTDPDPHNPV